MSSNISNKDKKDWENFLSSDEKLPNKDSKFSTQKSTTIKSFDFHGFSLDEANNKIRDLIKSSYDNGVYKLIVVTGKGLNYQNYKDPYVSKDFGILKYSVPEYIKKNTELMKLVREIKDASAEDGGSGAFYIYLKKKPTK